MISVAFDTSALLPDFKEHAGRGIGRYVRHLSEELALMSDPSRGKEALDLGFFNYNQLVRRGISEKIINLLPAGRTTIRQQLHYPLRLMRGVTRRYQLVHFPAHMDAPAWSNKATIVTVLDLIPLVCADLYRPDQGGVRFRLARFLEQRAIRRATCVLAISENTARDVERLLGVPAERIHVTPLGVDEEFFSIQARPGEQSTRQQLAIPPDGPLVLYVGGFDQRKNIAGLLDSFADSVERSAQQGLRLPRLVIAGRLDNQENRERFDGLVASCSAKERISVLGYVADEQLRRLYAESDVFFFTSLYEGFGLPPLEAMAAGLAVVSSNASCMPEVLGDAAHFFDPRDRAAASTALFDVLHTPQLSADLRRRGRVQARAYTWTRTAELTRKAYESAVRKSSHA